MGPEDELELRAPDGSLVWREPEHPGDDDARGRRLERMLREELRHRALLRLAATPGSVRLQAVFAIATAEECMRARGEPVTVAPHRAPEGSEAAGNEYRCVGGYLPDDRRLAILEVRNPTDEPVFVSVLSVAEDRARNVIWPTGGRRDCVLPPGEVERIPLLVVANENWEADHPMRDRYLVFATSEFADLEGFERASTLRAAGQSFEMPELILEALRGVVTRGSRRVPVRSEGWGVTAVDLLVDLP